MDCTGPGGTPCSRARLAVAASPPPAPLSGGGAEAAGAGGLPEELALKSSFVKLNMLAVKLEGPVTLPIPPVRMNWAVCEGDHAGGAVALNWAAHFCIPTCRTMGKGAAAVAGSELGGLAAL